MVKTDIRVIYGDTDQMGVVYYGNYLRYLEAGRTEYLRAVGIRRSSKSSSSSSRGPSIHRYSCSAQTRTCGTR